MRDDVRSRILAASLELLNEGGVGALSMREVARRAGVSHQAPYHHFADREAILAELVKDGFSQLHAYEARASEQSPPGAERITAIGIAYVSFALDQPALFQLMFRRELVELQKFPQTEEIADEAFNVPHAAVAEACGKSMDACMPEMLACWSMVHGLATLILEGKLDHQLGPGREARDACVREVMSLYSRQRYGEHSKT
ncbi:MAG: TetR/AcrR family transcriptional regulator [Hyphomonadaceae bacterium]